MNGEEEVVNEETATDFEQDMAVGLDDLNSLLGGMDMASEDTVSQAEESLLADDNSDIMDLLGQMSEDDALKDIEELLKAESNDIPLVEEVADIPEVSENTEEKELPKKKMFLGGLFGKKKAEGEGDEKPKKEKKAKKKKEKPIVEDNEEIIEDVEEELRLKEEREAKKLQKQEAKEAKKAEKAEKKKEKDAAKAEKKRLKEEKKANEPVVKSPPLPKAPVILIFVMAASICVVVLVTANLMPYTMYLGDAEKAFIHQDYESAWKEMLGMDIKEDDEKLHDQAKVMMQVKGKLNAYNNYMTMNQPSEALNSLICGIENYEQYKAEAKELGVEREFESVYNEMVNTLGAEFYLDPETVKSWKETLSPAQYTKMVRQAVGQ